MLHVVLFLAPYLSQYSVIINVLSPSFSLSIYPSVSLQAHRSRRAVLSEQFRWTHLHLSVDGTCSGATGKTQ